MRRGHQREFTTEWSGAEALTIRGSCAHHNLPGMSTHAEAKAITEGSAL